MTIFKKRLFLGNWMNVLFQVLQVVSGILHLGNVLFREEGSERAVIEASESEG